MAVLSARTVALCTRMFSAVMAARSTTALAAVLIAVLFAAIPAAWSVGVRSGYPNAVIMTAPPGTAAAQIVEARRRADFAAMQRFRPGYGFWRYVFTVPDGSIAFGSDVDGRLLATFPVGGDWSRRAVWSDPGLAGILEGQRLARRVGERREQVALLLERTAGPVMHNSTRGDALLRSAAKY